MSGQVHRVPTYEHWHGRVRAHGDQTESSELGMAVLQAVDLEEDHETCHRHQRTKDGEAEAVLEVVGEEGHYHAETECGGPGDGGVKLSFYF